LFWFVVVIGIYENNIRFRLKSKIECCSRFHALRGNETSTLRVTILSREFMGSLAKIKKFPGPTIFNEVQNGNL